MMLLQPCPYNNCKARLLCTYDDKAHRQMETTAEKLTKELRNRLKWMLKKAHANGEHNGR